MTNANRIHPRRIVLPLLLGATLAAPGALAKADRTSETWREAQIATTYALDEHLNPFEIDVEVIGATAVLTGQVESAIESELAEEIARGVDGVSRVENKLQIIPDAPRRTSEDSFARVVKDSTVTARVKSRLLWNRGTDGLDIHVTTNNGRVVLEGTAQTRAEAQLAYELASQTSGVQAVESKLKIAPGPVDAALDKAAAAKQKAAATTDNVAEKAKSAAASIKRTFSDTWITTKVKTALLTDKRFSATEVGIDTNDGVVMLTGEIGSEAERAQLVGVVHNIVGVKGVHAAALAVN